MASSSNAPQVSPKRPKRTALTDAWATSSSQKVARGRKTTESEVQTAVRKAVYDNLRDFNDTELYGTTDESGRTCWQRLTDDKRSWLNKDDGREKMGAYYYKKIKAIYSGPERLTNVIKISSDNLPREEMVAAIAQLRQHPPNRAPFQGLLRGTDVFGKGDVLAIMKVLAVNTPSCSKEHLNLGLDMIEALVRTKSWSLVPDETILLRDKVDEVLTQARTCMWRTMRYALPPLLVVAFWGRREGVPHSCEHSWPFGPGSFRGICVCGAFSFFFFCYP